MIGVNPLVNQREFDDRLTQWAEVAIRVGLGLLPGQELVILCSLEMLPSARKLTEAAYRAGASLVTPIFTDNEATLIRFHHADPCSFDSVPQWLYDGMESAHRRGVARLAIVGTDPGLLTHEDPAKVGRLTAATAKASRAMFEPLRRWETNWLVVAAATPKWAAMVFPDSEPAIAIENLWTAIFAAMRLDGRDPVETWRTHIAGLRRRADLLNTRRFRALHYFAPNTDLRVGLADDHIWQCAAAVARNGASFVPNLPTEEVFTMPHRDRADGWVASSMPMYHQGVLIQDLAVRFERGRIVEYRATQGREVFTRLLDTDEGARRLGEVALVPASSPIARSRMIYSQTLFDENAASHLALGESIPACLPNGMDLSPEEMAAKGGNESAIHVDWMIGSDHMDIDGIGADGASEAIMRKGEWVRRFEKVD